jgi:hypothetical protein
MFRAKIVSELWEIERCARRAGRAGMVSRRMGIRWGSGTGVEPPKPVLGVVSWD